ncbi:MAG: 4Fe-4S dicluster domain-containing protein, partial [Rhodocyclaceae bacterium]|nr:4Fe-4S dicluster domain-containing protein [Rhodocyclaceae bacterium]
GAPLPVQGRRQSQDERAALDGLLECSLCACCTAACPSWRRGTQQFAGPAALLHVARFAADSRDAAREQRLDDVDDAGRLFACRSAMSCTAACPQGLNPAAAISALRVRLARRSI